MRTLKIHCGTVTAAIACCLLSGCAVYLDNPPKQTFRGQVLFKDTPIPVAESRVSVWSPRRYLVLPPLPVDGLDIVGHAQTDAAGRFELPAKGPYPAKIYAQTQHPDYGSIFGETELTQPPAGPLVIRLWPQGEGPRAHAATSPSTP